MKKEILVSSFVALMILSGCSEKPAQKEEQTVSQPAATETVEPKVEMKEDTVVDEKTEPVVEEKTAMEFDANMAFLKCVACHGADGSKAALGKSAIIKGQSKDEVFTSLKGYKDGSRNVSGMGALMKSQVATYSEEELEQIADFVSKL